MFVATRLNLLATYYKKIGLDELNGTAKIRCSAKPIHGDGNIAQFEEGVALLCSSDSINSNSFS